MLRVVCLVRAVPPGRARFAARCRERLSGCVSAVGCSLLSSPRVRLSRPDSAPGRCLFTAASRTPQSSRKDKVALKWDAPALSTTQKVKEAGRDLTYLAIVVVGIAVTGGLFYVIFKELFSSSSPNKLYGVALEKCRAHPEIIGVLGRPIKGYGETTRRGRRRHVSHREYIKNGTKHIQLVFYIEGIEPIKGTVHLDAKENPESGRYEFCYIFVDFDTYPKRSIIVEDNR